MSKGSNPARSFHISHRTKTDGKDEWRVLHGNRVISRHSTENEADDAFYIARDCRAPTRAREGV